MIITIPKNVTHGDELIIVPKSEYEALQRKAAKIDELMDTIRSGEKEIKEGKVKYTKRSIAEVIKR